MILLDENLERQNKLRDILGQSLPEIRQAMLDAALLEEARQSGGNPHFVENLLDLGAELNTRDATGSTPLILAAGSGQTQVVELLLKKHPDVHARNSDDKSAHDHATEHGNDAAARIIRHYIENRVSACTGTPTPKFKKMQLIRPTVKP